MKKTLLVTGLLTGMLLAQNVYAAGDPCSGFHNDYNPETGIITVTGEGVISAGCLNFFDQGNKLILSEGITGIDNLEEDEWGFWETVGEGENSEMILVPGTITLTAPTVSATAFSCHDDPRGLYPCSNTNISYVISDNTKIEVDEDEADSWCGESSKEGPVCNDDHTANIYCLGDSQKCAENIADFADFLTEKSGLQLVNILETTQTTENGITTVKDANGNTLASYPAKSDNTPESTKEVKRIYTVEEASRIVSPQGNTFKIRYR